MNIGTTWWGMPLRSFSAPMDGRKRRRAGRTHVTKQLPRPERAQSAVNRFLWVRPTRRRHIDGLCDAVGLSTRPLREIPRPCLAMVVVVVVVVVLVVLVVVVLCGAALADSPLKKFKGSGDAHALKVGEQLTYSIHWLGLSVGTAVMRVKEISEERGKPAYVLTIQVRSGRAIRWIYRVEDDAVSVVEVEGFRPLRFDKRLREGKRKKDEIVDFDWKKKEATYYKVHGETPKKRRAFPLEKGAQDSLSCLYFLRSLPLTIGTESIMKVATERKCWNLKVTPLRKEKLKLKGLGKFDTIVLEPLAEFEGLFVRKDKKLTMWLDEETGIMLKMAAKVPIGSVTVCLSGFADTVEEPGKAVDMPRTGPIVSRREIRKEKTGKVPWKEEKKRPERE